MTSEKIEEFYRKERVHIFRFFRIHCGQDIQAALELTQGVFLVLLCEKERVKSLDKFAWGVAWRMKHDYRRSARFRYRFRQDLYHEGISCGDFYTEDKLAAACDARACGAEGWQE